MTVSNLPTGWVEDPAGLHFIRRDLLPASAAIVGVFLVVGIALHRGNEGLYLTLLVVALAQFGLAIALNRLGHRLTGAQQLRIVLSTTPLTFLVLAMAGWNGEQSEFQPAIPAMIAGTLAMVVALTEPRSVLIPWVGASAVALILGGLIEAGPTGAVLLPAACLLGEAFLAWLIRDGIQRYHADRRAIVHAVSALLPLQSPESTAAEIVQLLDSWIELESVVILRFTTLDETVVVASLNRTSPDGLRVGEVLPDTRSDRPNVFVLASGGYSRASVAPLAPRPQAKPGWLLFVRVADVKAAAAKAISLGGRVLVAPSDAPTEHWRAVIADPTGAVIGLVQLQEPGKPEEQP